MIFVVHVHTRWNKSLNLIVEPKYNSILISNCKHFVKLKAKKFEIEFMNVVNRNEQKINMPPKIVRSLSTQKLWRNIFV